MWEPYTPTKKKQLNYFVFINKNSIVPGQMHSFLTNMSCKFPDGFHLKYFVFTWGWYQNPWFLSKGTKSLKPDKEDWPAMSFHILQTQAGMVTKTKHLVRHGNFSSDLNKEDLSLKNSFGDNWRLGSQPVSLVNNSLVFTFSLGIVSPDTTN